MEIVNVPFLDVKKINLRFESEFSSAQKEVLHTDFLINGDALTTFENAFAHYCGTRYCVGTSNGLDALSLIFKALVLSGRLQQGDEVLVPAFTYIATVLSVVHAGLKPVFVEPNTATFNIDLADAEKKLTPKTKAVLPVHLYGQLADMEKLNAWAKKSNLWVVEDAAQAHGAQNLNANKAGSFGHAAAFSFYPTKNLGALGDAGAVTTNDAKLSALIRKLSNYGRSDRYTNEILGVNCRLDTLQAAYLTVKLKHLDADNLKRQEIARRYLTEIKHPEVVLPKVDDFSSHVFHLFVIRTQNRQALQQHLTQNGVETQIHYPLSPHLQQALKPFKTNNLPLTEQLQDEVLSLPISPVMTKQETDRVISVINQF